MLQVTLEPKLRILQLIKVKSRLTFLQELLSVNLPLRKRASILLKTTSHQRSEQEATMALIQAKQVPLTPQEGPSQPPTLGNRCLRKEQQPPHQQLHSAESIH